MRMWRLAASVVWLTLICTAAAGEAEPLRPGEALKRRQISDLQLSPEGHFIAFVVSEPVRGTEQNRDVYVLDLSQRSVRRLTTSEKSDASPRWSPKGGLLAFISARTDKAQIYLLPMSGGEAQALTELDTPIRSFAWAPDGASIAFVAEEPKSEEAKKKEKEKDDARVVDRDARPLQLWLIDLSSRKPRHLTRGRWRISDFTWAPGGDRILLAGTDDPHPELFTTRIYALSVADGTMNLLARPAGPFTRLRVSPDGRYLTYVGSRGEGPTPHDLFLQPTSGGTPKNLTVEPIDRDIAGTAWIDETTLLLQAANGFTNDFYRLNVERGVEDRFHFDTVHALGSFAASGNLLAFVGETPTQPQELWISTRAGAAERLSAINEDWTAARRLIEPETLTYPSFDGTSIEAALLRPPAGQARGPLPLVVLVHGGPSGRWSARFHSWGQLLATRGYAVLYPNIRGSTGYGHRFLAMNRRDWGGGDFGDVMAGVDDLVERGVADPSRVGIAGWSYGGYMAAWAVTQTDRFKASVSGAPMTDLASEYGTERSSINAYDTWYLGSPYENLELFTKRSPITYVRHVTTPTLLLCGEKDAVDPIGQCYQFYRGLKRYGVETELVVYPREGHGIREEKHQLDVLERMLDWFDRHVPPTRSSIPSAR